MMMMMMLLHDITDKIKYNKLMHIIKSRKRGRHVKAVKQ